MNEILYWYSFQHLHCCCRVNLPHPLENCTYKSIEMFSIRLRKCCQIIPPNSVVVEKCEGVRQTERFKNDLESRKERRVKQRDARCVFTGNISRDSDSFSLGSSSLTFDIVLASSRRRGQTRLFATIAACCWWRLGWIEWKSRSSLSCDAKMNKQSQFLQLIASRAAADSPPSQRNGCSNSCNKFFQQFWSLKRFPIQSKCSQKNCSNTLCRTIV